VQERLWCEHDYLRWGVHNTSVRQLCSISPYVLVAPASLIGSEFPQSTWLRPFSLCPSQRMGERQADAPPFPLTKGVSKHTTLCEDSTHLG